jgi:hypothetical protein
MDRKELEKLSRQELIAKAESLGITRPRTLTMPELIDEILLATSRTTGQKRPRGWFGRARDLLTSVVDRGLSNDPKKGPARAMPAAPPPLPTVTLAEIYAAQGHFERAIATLDEVIARDAGHDEAKRLRERFSEQMRRQRPSRPPISSSPSSEGEGVTAAGLTRELQKKDESGEPTGLTAQGLTPEIQPAASAPPASGAQPEAPAPPAPPATAPELADRYDVDEVVAIAVDPHTIYTYWEVRAATLATLRNEKPSGALVLRVLAVGTGTPGPDARDIRVDAAIGELFVRDLPANAEIRVAIGWLADGVLQPVAVGLELATPREAPSTEVAVHFGRMASGGVGEPYDALRAGGLVGAPPVAGFPRSTPEEVSLGHAAPRRAGFEGDVPPGVFTDVSETVEPMPGAPDVTVITRVETRRIGASELLTRETVEQRFIGASEAADRKYVGASDLSNGRARGPRPGGVSFARRS